MFLFPYRKNYTIRLCLGSKLSPVRFPPILSLSFLVGLLTGTVVGVFSDSGPDLLTALGFAANNAEYFSFFRTLWRSSIYVILAALLATDIFGAFMIPLLSAIRAFSFACTIGAVLQTWTLSSALFAFITFGIPSLFSLPAFFVAEADAFILSLHFLLRNRPGLFREYPFFRHILFVISFCAADAAYLRYLLPVLTGILS